MYLTNPLKAQDTHFVNFYIDQNNFKKAIATLQCIDVKQRPTSKLL